MPAPMLPSVLTPWPSAGQTVLLRLLGGARVKKLLLCGTGDDVEEDALAGAEDQRFAGHCALEQGHLGRREVEGLRRRSHRTLVQREQNVGRAVVDYRQAVG
jgi:hypothetical protein